MVSHLNELGRRLHALIRELPDDDAVTDTLDYIADALYGLDRALMVGFVDRGTPFHDTYRAFLSKYVLDIIEHRPLHEFAYFGDRGQPDRRITVTRIGGS
jgi:hypothetical protein